MRQVNNILSATKVTKGYALQLKAKHAFDNNNFLEAYHLYNESENFYRQGFKTAGPRIFFMQSTAIRCLEELIDSGRVDLINLHRERASAFFKEWSDKSIQFLISPSRVHEAFAFRLWRETYNKERNKFYQVGAAIQRKDFDLAREVLIELIGKLQSQERTPELLQELALAKSKLELITVREELSKPEGERLNQRISDAFGRAAFACRGNGELTMHMPDAKLDAYAKWYESHKNKYAAFAIQFSDDDTDLIKRLEKSELLLSEAVKLARDTLDGPTGGDFPRGYFDKLSFLYYLIRKRLFLFRFMETCDDNAYRESVVAWESCLSSAKVITAERGEDSLFPNFHYGLDDLELEGLLLQAAEAFRKNDWDRCILNLKQWRQKLPSEYLWSWRDIQNRLRLHLAMALEAFQQSDLATLESIGRELDLMVRGEHIGNVGRFLVGEIRGLQLKAGIPLTEDYLSVFYRNFPIDAVTTRYTGDSQSDPLLSLPEKIYKWLEQSKLATDPIEIEKSKIKLQACVQTVLGYVCDYYAQIYPELVFPQAFDIHQLLEWVTNLISKHFAKRSVVNVGIKNLTAAISESWEINTPADYEDHYTRLVGAIKDLTEIVPLIVSVSGSQEDGSEFVEATPDWSLSSQKVERNKILLSASWTLNIAKGEYYLPPEWCRGNRLFYRIKRGSPLRHVTYQPDWPTWDARANSTMLLEGILYDHLLRSIELAEQCVPEDDKIHPKVGAVIVRNGQVLGEAYRNMDGTGGHAEQIAVATCKKNGVDLAGATIIATLEPCTGGRSIERRPCAEIILAAGITQVIIGTVDPNRKIRGSSELFFVQNNISVGYFPSDLRKRLSQMNREFIQQYVEDFKEVILLV